MTQDTENDTQDEVATAREQKEAKKEEKRAARELALAEARELREEAKRIEPFVKPAETTLKLGATEAEDMQEQLDTLGLNPKLRLPASKAVAVAVADHLNERMQVFREDLDTGKLPLETSRVSLWCLPKGRMIRILVVNRSGVVRKVLFKGIPLQAARVLADIGVNLDRQQLDSEIKDAFLSVTTDEEGEAA